MPHLAHIANLWSLVGHPSSAKEWSLKKKINAIAAAGFDGITTRMAKGVWPFFVSLCHVLHVGDNRTLEP